MVIYTVTESLLGPLVIVSNGVSLTNLGFLKGPNPTVPLKDWKKIEEDEVEKHPELQKAVNQLDEYFKGKRKKFDLDEDPHGTEFQKKVWKGLKDIPYGETTSYMALAKKLGLESKSGNDWHLARAVGSANAKNPLCICVPCHRVIGADGSLVGYIGGLDVKKKLLDLEQKNKQDVVPAPKDEENKDICKYGEECFRKNPQHLAQYTHRKSISPQKDKKRALDEEEEDNIDHRPDCVYGTDCYRKNPEHLQNFRHPKKQKWIS